MRSMKIITVVEMVDTTSGKDTLSTSRPPQGRAHQS
jgi:hypothetical protein